MAATTDTSYDLIKAAYTLLTVTDEITPPSAEQATVGLEVLNDMMANYYVDGIRTMWYPQTQDIYSVRPAPMQDYDVQGFKVLLAKWLALRYGINMEPDLKEAAEYSFETLSKRYIEYVQTDLTGLPFSQGGLFGPGRV